MEGRKVRAATHRECGEALLELILAAWLVGAAAAYPWLFLPGVAVAGRAAWLIWVREARLDAKEETDI